jgi:beta-phosphoglucomutase
LNVVPVNTPPNDGADRPIDTQLVTKTNGYNFTNIRIGLERCFSKLWHPKIKENPGDLFFLIDLDGTLVDTEPLHHDAYHKVLGYDVDVKTIIETRGIDSYLKEKYDTTEFNRIKREKLEWMLKMNDVKFMKNADTFINTINELGINHCVVTNTNKVVVDHFREKLPLLNKLKNWITREDYDLPKPNSECFELAIKRYKGEEKYIIGFENSEVGYNSLRQVTDCIYLFNENMKSEDCYIINDFNLIY